MKNMTKIFYLLGLSLVLASSAAAQSPTGGTVVDPNNSAVQGAKVSVRRGAEIFTTTTDEAGRFGFANLPDGNYTLTVNASGFSVFTREIKPDETLAITLAVANIAEAVVIQAEVDGYFAETSTTGTKLDIPQRDLPQAISIVPRQILQDRVLIRLTETADNVSAVRALTGYSGTKSNNYLIRGFTLGFSSPNNLRNGFTEFSFLSQRDPVNIERVEFLKGPASLLYGASEVAGLVNTVTKKPLPEHRYELGLAFGGFSLVRPTIDATGPLNNSKSLLYRVNFAYDQANSYRDFVDNRNAFLAPAMLWKIGARTTLNAEVELGRFRNDFDRGFPTESEFLSEERSKNYAEPWTRALNRQVNVMLNLTHAFNERFSLRSGFSHIRSKTDLNSVSFGFFALAADRRTINRTNLFSDEYSENYNSQNEFYARFSTGGIHHQLVAGAEYTRFQFRYVLNFNSLASIDRINPVYGALPGFFLFNFNDDSLANQFGVYVQDQISLLKNLKLLIGGRASYVDSTSRDFSTAALRNSQIDRAFTPRAGIVYQPTPTTSVYFSFAQSFAPNYLSRSRRGEQFKPTSGRLYEAGVKQSLLNNRVLATFALYQLQRRNVLVPDPVEPFAFSIQTGEQRSRGLEIEINGQVARGLNLNATYAAVEAIVSRDSRAIFVGNRLVGVPKHSGGIYSNYVFDKGLLRGFSVGAGSYFASERFASLPNRLWRLPAYERVDLNFGYRRENWRFDVAVKNLNNALHHDTGGFQSILPQAPRHAVASVSYIFR